MIQITKNDQQWSKITKWPKWPKIIKMTKMINNDQITKIDPNDQNDKILFNNKKNKQTARCYDLRLTIHLTPKAKSG